jgi:hypothetical protein
MVQPSSTEFSRQNAWADNDIEDLQESPILAASFKRELTRESQIVIVQIRSQSGFWKPLKNTSKSWLTFCWIRTVEAASP